MYVYIHIHMSGCLNMYIYIYIYIYTYNIYIYKYIWFLAKKTILVTDGWKGTKAAVKALKTEKGWGDAELWHEVVNHSAGEIVNANGFTTNHIEQRWSAVKRWVRKRSGGMMPSHSDRSKWARLLPEFWWRKIVSRDHSLDGGRTWHVPLVESLTALRARKSTR